MQFDEGHWERNPGARSGFEKYVSQARQKPGALRQPIPLRVCSSDNALAEE